MHDLKQDEMRHKMKKNQEKQQRKSNPSTKQQGLRSLGGRIKARNRPETRKTTYIH